MHFVFASCPQVLLSPSLNLKNIYKGIKEENPENTKEYYRSDMTHWRHYEEETVNQKMAFFS